MAVDIFHWDSHFFEAAFKKIDPDQLDKLATGARWRFRLGSGPDVSVSTRSDPVSWI